MQSKQILSFAALAVAATMLMACSTAGIGGKFQAVSPKSGNGIVYVYNTLYGWSNHIKGAQYITVDGAKLGHIGGGLHYVIELPPGAHVIGYHELLDIGGEITGRNRVSVAVAAGREYYVRIGSDVQIIPIGNTAVVGGERFPVIVSEAQGRAEIAESLRAEPDQK
jgi:hypothetical protein